MSEALFHTTSNRSGSSRRTRAALLVLIGAILCALTLVGLRAFPWKRLRWSVTPAAALSLFEEQPNGTWITGDGSSGLKYPGDPLLVLRVGTLRFEWQRNAETAEEFLNRLQPLNDRATRQLAAGDIDGSSQTCDLILAQRIPEHILGLRESAFGQAAFRSCRILASRGDYAGALSRYQEHRGLLQFTVYCTPYPINPYEHSVALWRLLAKAGNPVAVLREVESGSRKLKVTGYLASHHPGVGRCIQCTEEAQLALAELFLRRGDFSRARVELAHLKKWTEHKGSFILDDDPLLVGCRARLRRAQQHVAP